MGDGTTWAKAGNDLKSMIDSITNASANNIYVILVASGKYTPKESYSMKNHVAIVGGFTTDNTYHRDGETRLDGNGQRRLFTNSGLNNTALLYGVTITDGNVGVNNDGGGMFNHASSPILINVTFSDNTATYAGGGMFNLSSSFPTLINTLLWGNDSTVDSTSKSINTGDRIYYSLIEGGAVDSDKGVITNDPGDLTFGNDGGVVSTYSILATSAAKDAGAYVKGVKTGNTYASNNVYYSTDKANWYRASDNQPVESLSAGTDDLTATDTRGYGRVGRPDIGAYEVGGTAP